MLNTFYPTTKGQRYIAKAMEAGKQLTFTKSEFGNGVLPEGALPASYTELMSSLGTMAITKFQTKDNTFVVSTDFTNRINGSILPAFRMTEAGLFGKIVNKDGSIDQDYPEALILYGAVPESQADYIQAVLTEFRINWPLTVDGNADMTVVIDESMVYYTKEEANEKFVSSEQMKNDFLTREEAEKTYSKQEDAKSVLVPHTIPASGWKNGLYAFNNENIKRDTQPIEMLKGDNMTTEQLEIAQGANIQHESQIAGKLIIRAHGDVPTVDLSVKFLIRGDL